MSRSFMNLFMVSVDTRLNKNLFLILNFFFIAFMLGWIANLLIMELIVSFLDVTKVSLGQLRYLTSP